MYRVVASCNGDRRQVGFRVSLTEAVKLAKRHVLRPNCIVTILPDPSKKALGRAGRARKRKRR